MDCPRRNWADDGEVEDYLVNIVDLGADFGDALDPPYPTLLANDGARHTIMKGFFLGANVDGEIDGQPSAGASADIDDGVTFPQRTYGSYHRNNHGQCFAGRATGCVD